MPTDTGRPMYAVRQIDYGGPEVLRIAEVERPEPGPGEVLVRVRAAGVNPADWKIRAGLADHRFLQPPFTPGLDMAGEVEAIGSEVAGFGPGDRVYGMVYPPRGAQAQYTLAKADMLASVPPGVDLVQAGGLATAGLTAWQALARASVNSGQRVLVHAAAGGVGHLAVQIAKAHGAYVIGTARSEKHAFLRRLGADEVIDYTSVDFAEVVGSAVDVVLDPLGDDYGPRSLAVLSPGGAYIDLRQPNPGRPEIRARAQELGIGFADITVAPRAEDLADLVALAADGLVRVEVERTLPLSQVAEAHALSEAGRVKGKIVLIP
ncbi:NADPH:quinone reductase [Streptomyces zinciresistens K42]|uniref:NADPH:quinone reductase n=1 Tax=Streptomyces zinciresistens K42 TaxID=700597 RepID=G2GL98_9ACTN|nr:NADP-dependent oxidoreductase [Streptomyces zinciresistens]EGX55712.1 NADPH:quinone reductase [Streptomyces zinciresistens K42]